MYSVNNLYLKRRARFNLAVKRKESIRECGMCKGTRAGRRNLRYPGRRDVIGPHPPVHGCQTQKFHEITPLFKF